MTRRLSYVAAALVTFITLVAALARLNPPTAPGPPQEGACAETRSAPPPAGLRFCTEDTALVDREGR